MPRHAAALLEESLEDSPVSLVHGPRQCGKTTLALQVGGPRGYSYMTLDDEVVLQSARRDPVGFVLDLPDRVILDEIQRVPRVFLALKRSVDRNRVPGRFILTGSSNVLLVPQLADSLAGRMQAVRLHPYSQMEIGRQPRTGSFLGRLFAGRFSKRRSERMGRRLYSRITTGGYPPALLRRAGPRRVAWYRNYIESQVQRDVRDLARIRSLEVLPRLLTLAGNVTGQLFNLVRLSSPFQVSRNTIRDYFTLLERQFLVERLPPWHSNRLNRLVKTPKIHVGDTGLACALIGADPEELAANRSILGQMLETFVYQELRRQESGLDGSYSFYHFRDRDGAEVDIVIERGLSQIAGVEVKAAATVAGSDFRGLRKLRSAAGSRFACGAVLYDGEASVSFGDRLYALPLRVLWENDRSGSGRLGQRSGTALYTIPTEATR